jgi:hypothetical protein
LFGCAFGNGKKAKIDKSARIVSGDEVKETRLSWLMKKIEGSLGARQTGKH